MKIKPQIRRSTTHDVSGVFFDPLESRVLLSGNVTASVSNGQLNLQGNCLNNSIVVDQVALATSQLRVSSGDGTTSINGQSGALCFSGVSGISIKLGSGNDTLVIQNATVANGVQLSATGGNQLFTLSDVTIGGSFTLTNSGGQNSTTLENSSVAGSVTVNAGVGYSNSCGSFWGCSYFANANEVFTLSGSTVGNSVSISNVSGETTTDIEYSSVGSNLTVTNGASSYGNCGFNYGFNSGFKCGSKCAAATPTVVGDLLTLNGSTVGNNVAVSNASDGNATNIVNSSINGSLTVSNVVGTSSQCSFGCSWSGNLAQASDAFVLFGSTVGSNVTLANISDGATADIESSTILGALSINDGVGSYGQGFTWCAGQSSSNFGDLLTLNASTIINNVAITNGSTFNSTDIESSTILGSMAVSNGLNFSGSSGKTSCDSDSCGSHSCDGNSCGTIACGGNAVFVYTTDLFTLNASTLGNNLSVSNASGYTNTAVESSTIANNMTITNASGVSYFEMDSSIIGYNCSFTAGVGVANVNVINSLIANNATISVASGAIVVVNPSQVVNQLSITV
jgi:hypothetical protein